MKRYDAIIFLSLALAFSVLVTEVTWQSTYLERVQKLEDQTTSQQIDALRNAMESNCRCPHNPGCTVTGGK